MKSTELSLGSLEAVPSAPWKNRTRRHLLSVAIASLLPLVLAFLIVDHLRLSGFLGLLFVFLPLQFLAAGLAAFLNVGKRGISDALLSVLIFFLVAIMGALLGSVAMAVIVKGGKSISTHFLFQNSVYMTTVTSIDYGGVGHAVIGTLLIVGIASLFAIPLGIAVGIFLTESQSRLRQPVRLLSQAMSGLPSIVSGLFILSALFLTGLIDSSGILGSAALFLLMLPTIIRLSEEVLKLVPQELRLAALALGASRHKAFFQVVFPAARSGIITTVLLGVARVIGETAPLIVLVIYVPSTNLNPLSGGMAALPSYIYTWLKYSTDVANQRAWGGALALMVLVGVLFTLARYFGRKALT